MKYWGVSDAAKKPMREIHAPCQQSNPVKPSQGSLTGKLWFEGEMIRDLVADTIILEWTRGNENG